MRASSWMIFYWRRRVKGIFRGFGQAVIGLLLSGFMPNLSLAETDSVHIAVAANFAGALKTIAKKFERQSGYKVIISIGSTGKLYAQIVQGAPYDLYFAADKVRPEKLVAQKLTLENQPIRYATGILALWAPSINLSEQPLAKLSGDAIAKISMANIKTAPYGMAAMQVLGTHPDFQRIKEKLVYGESVAQAFHVVASGQVQAGFVAYSQLVEWGESQASDIVNSASVWTVPKDLYSPVEQYRVRLKHSRNNKAATAFLAFLASAEGQDIIRRYGYEI